MLTKRHYYENARANRILKEEYLQTTYLMKDLYTEHITCEYK